jgi:hypothetical protein
MLAVFAPAVLREGIVGTTFIRSLGVITLVNLHLFGRTGTLFAAPLVVIRLWGMRNGVFRYAILLASAIAAAFASDLQPIAMLSPAAQPLHIDAPAQPRMPFTVAGEYGAVLGRENGVFESWLWPVKILSNFRISAELADYPVPIDVNALAAVIQVTPAETVITYSHAAFTIRQHMFAPRGAGKPATGAVVFFEVQSARPLEITFSFTPDMLRMWPAPNFGRPNGEWVSQGDSGFYILHTDNPRFSAVIAMPRARPGILVPYQEHPQTYPLQLKLSFDPKRDAGLEFPLLMAMLDGSSGGDEIARVNAAIPSLYRTTQFYYAHFFDSRLTVETPDERVNRALQWAEVAIDQMQVSYGGEIGLVAGYYASADSARPGFAWFFGRDTLWTSFAINSYGDFALARRALDFLIHRQRADGKMMHEFSQSAKFVNWSETPYFYASADATPLFVMTMWDYVRTSGDMAYLKANWEAVLKSYRFTRAHQTNGVYDNTEGTGWVESWPPGMPHQEIYLAAVDQQSADSMAHLAALMGDRALAAEAQRTAEQIRSKIESEFFEPNEKFYAFSRNVNGMLDRTATIFPSVAWWDGNLVLSRADDMLNRWASAEFSTDWGTRDISNRTPFYDPISYHQGSVWPLFTGWVSVAEYRAGRPLSGYAHLMQNVDLTWTQDLGSVTELLSGEFFEPLGRSTPHQMWSSAMIISPLLRGLFGLEWNAQEHMLRLNPHLPEEWDRALLHHVRVGPRTLDLEFRREGSHVFARILSPAQAGVCIAGVAANSSCGSAMQFPLPPVEVSIPAALPWPGAQTAQLKVIGERYLPSAAEFQLAAPGGSTYDLPLRLNRVHPPVQGASLASNKLHIEFPSGAGYQVKTVRFIW